MTRHEYLIEQYEDAYFALLMDEVAQTEGQRLEQLNIELQKEPSAKVPVELDKKCLQIIDRYFTKRQKRTSYFIIHKGLNVAAIIIAISTLIFTTAFAISPEVRITTANLVMTMAEHSTKLEMNHNASSVDQTNAQDSLQRKYFNNMEIRWLPDGYEYTEGKPDFFARFENSSEDWILISMAPSNTINIDTEDADTVESIEINDMQGLSIQKNGKTHIVLANPAKRCYINVIVSQNLTPEIAIKIVENIIIF